MLYQLSYAGAFFDVSKEQSAESGILKSEGRFGMQEFFGPVPLGAVIFLAVFSALIVAVMCPPTRWVEWMEEEIKKRRERAN